MYIETNKLCIAKMKSSIFIFIDSSSLYLFKMYIQSFLDSYRFLQFILVQNVYLEFFLKVVFSIARKTLGIIFQFSRDYYETIIHISLNWSMLSAKDFTSSRHCRVYSEWVIAHLLCRQYICIMVLHDIFTFFKS